MSARREPGRLAIVPPDPRRRCVKAAAAPGPVERSYRLAENAALLSAGFAPAPTAAHAASELPDDYGLRPGPAQGYRLRESRESVQRRRRWLCAAVALFVVALVLGFA